MDNCADDVAPAHAAAAAPSSDASSHRPYVGEDGDGETSEPAPPVQPASQLPTTISLGAIHKSLQDLVHIINLQQTQLRHLIGRICLSYSLEASSVDVSGQKEAVGPCCLTSGSLVYHHRACRREELLRQIARLEERIDCVSREMLFAKARNSELQSQITASKKPCCAAQIGEEGDKL